MGFGGEGPSSASTALADNRRLVLEMLRTTQEATRSEIALATGLSSAATARITAQLETERLIARTALAPSGGGRPAWRYRFTAEHRYVAGLRLQAGRCSGVLVDWHAAIQERVAVPVSDLTTSGYVDAAIQTAQLLRDGGARLGGVPVALGVAVPAVVEAEGVVGAGYEVPLRGIPLGDALTAALDVPVIVENDANALVYSELDGTTATSSLAGLLFGFGVGAGVVTEGRLLRGAHRAAGEIGYLLTGRDSLAEAVCEAGALERHIQSVAGGPDASPLRVWNLLTSNDPGAAARAAEVLDYVALAVASLATVVDPERIIIGDAPDELGLRLVEELNARLDGRLLRLPPLILAERGTDAVALGAALLAMSAVDLQSL